LIQKVSLRDGLHLEDYAGLADLSSAVQDLRSSARVLAPTLKGRTVWMVNSAAQGGGAEMMPRLIGMLQDVGVKTEWVVMGSKDPAHTGHRSGLETPSPHVQAYDHAVFSAAEYMPSCLVGTASVIHPASGQRLQIRD
jgi:hypothetical protein